jgi:hypothetical protein
MHTDDALPTKWRPAAVILLVKIGSPDARMTTLLTSCGRPWDMPRLERWQAMRQNREGDLLVSTTPNLFMRRALS